jgi:phage terminase large subunit-like protein
MAISVQRAKYEKARRLAQRSLLAFLRWCWWMPHDLVVGRHTRAICDRLTRASDDWREGKSTYLLIAVPFRHGKSDIVSRAFPAWFLGRNADRQPDGIMSGYGVSLVRGFSKRVKRIMSGERYKALFPGVLPARGSNKAEEWQVEGSAGTVVAQGLGGAVTGKGAHFLIIDDYCKNRAEAVSSIFREKTWDSFRNDLMTRLNAPANVVIVCATPWHIDDLRGRIRKAMAEDPNFPRFEELNFPASKPGVYDYLFPERFGPEWYNGQRSSLGKQAPALLDCEPMVEGGNRFDASRVVIHQTLDGWPQLREVRGWDLASSAKERDKDDPDWTWGVRGCVKSEATGVGALRRNNVWIRSMVACRSEAPERDALMRATAQQDGYGIAQHVEAFGGYKDAYTTLRSVLMGVSVVRPSRLPGDKSAKLSALEPSFEAGIVHVYAPGCGKFLDMWKSQFSAFPDGGHDDACDATAVMYHAQTDSGGSSMLI